MKHFFGFSLIVISVLLGVLSGCTVYKKPWVPSHDVPVLMPASSYKKPWVPSHDIPVLMPASSGENRSLFITPMSPLVTYGQVSLWGLNLNNSGNKMVALPGQKIPATVAYIYDCPECAPASFNQIIIGIERQGAQACLYNGLTKGQGIAYFTLQAPEKRGVYKILFRYAQAYNCADAVKYWWTVDHSPTREAIVGHVIVR